MTATFSLLDPLPERRLALEASAGTGKTFTLAALATRLLAETDVGAADLLVVTFTRAATAELRARIRDRLVLATEHLGHAEPPATDDAVLAHLATGSADDLRARRDRLQRAVTDFDAATITTIHGFATQVLTTLGIDAGIDPDATLTDDDDVLVADACADVLVAAAAEGVHPAASLPTLTKLVGIVTSLLAIPDLELAPAPPANGKEHDPADLLLIDLARRARAAIEARRRRDGTMSFDDILTKLRHALDPSRPGHEVVRTALRNRFRVALIDEFQDTDPVQWAIFSALFGGDERSGDDGASTEPGTDRGNASSNGAGAAGATRLVLVGDPKQAIYAFRGANIHTYLSAVHTTAVTERRSLGTNWRSDGAVIDSLQALLDGTTFGHADIAFHPVDTAPDHAQRRITKLDGTPLPALSLRLALDAGFDRADRAPNDIDTRQAERAIYRDLVAGVRELLDDAQLPDDDAPDGVRRVHPGDIAVLVRTGMEASIVQRELIDQGIPAVLSRGSVLESPAAEQWRWLLWGLQRPSDPRRARTAALSWFGGRDADWVARATDDELAAFQQQLVEWADTLQHQGVMAFVRQLWAESGVMARVLRQRDGDRNITDLDHIGELLQTTAPPSGASVAGLLTTLDVEPQDNPDADLDSDLVARRIESEAEAVKIMTVWVAKGLQFPIVCAPTMWRHRYSNRIYVDPDTGQRTMAVVAGDWPSRKAANDIKRLFDAESAGENLRLLYVALTRAQHHTMLWWTRAKGSRCTGLARVLFARKPEGDIDPEAFGAASVRLPDDAEAAGFLRPLVARGRGTIELREQLRDTKSQERWVAPGHASPRPVLSVATLDHQPDRAALRWSFSTILREGAEAHADPYDPTGADRGAADEVDTSHGAEPDEADAPVLFSGSGSSDTDPGHKTGESVVSAPLATLPAGATFGTFVHSVFEHVDFAADDLPAALADVVAEQQKLGPVDLTPVTAAGAPPPEPALTTADGERLLTDGLDAAIRTPLGPLLGGRTLRDFGRGDRLDELEFQLRLGQGAGRAASVADVGALTLRHLADDDPLREWAGSLAEGVFDLDLAGHLTGSIDAILRVQAADEPPRFVVVDYKTNRLNAFGEQPSATDYAPAGLATAMAHAHYPLQILLYSVALHRYLRWRLAGYDPAVHLGGAAYLFVRGMRGPATPVTNGHPDGVFSWGVPPALVVELSDLLDGQGTLVTPEVGA